MNPVTISVIPALKVNQQRYKIPEDAQPLEDYSLVLCRIADGDKTYEIPMILKNSQLPLDQKQLDGFRTLARKKLAEARP